MRAGSARCCRNAFVFIAFPLCFYLTKRAVYTAFLSCSHRLKHERAPAPGQIAVMDAMCGLSLSAEISSVWVRPSVHYR